MRERWYVVTSWAGKPEPVTVVKETEKTISIETDYFG